jgi:adenylate cyclase
MSIKEGFEDKFLVELQAIIEQHIDETDFTIDHLCREVGLSRSQLHRKIKTACGLSTSLFIRRVRLGKAQGLLESTHLNISEIAFKTGFSSPSSFSRHFVKNFGKSPSDYRKQHQKKTKSHSRNMAESPLSAPSDLAKTIQAGTAQRQRHIYFFIAVAMFVVAGLLLGYYFTERSDVVLPSADVENASIAVLPFKKYSPEKDAFFAEGVVEDILAHLTKFEDIRVISRTSSDLYRNSDKTLREIAKELGVAYILEGSIRENKDKIRITAQLISAKTDKHIWAKNYDRPKADALQIQSEVALKIARALGQEISQEAREKIQRLPTKNEEAYKALLQGRRLLRKRIKAEIEESIRYFDLALELDPDFSEAYSGKANAYQLLTNIYYKNHDADAFLALAEKNALLAIKANTNNAQAYAILGNIYREQYRWKEALTTYEIALELDPNDAQINYWNALLLRSLGKLDQSLTYHQIANNLDPLHPVISAGYLYTSSLAGQYDLTEKMLEEAMQIFKNSFLHVYVEGFNLMAQERYAEAIPLFDRSLSLNPQFRPVATAKAYCQGKLGEKEAALAFLARQDTSEVVGCFSSAVVSMGLNKSGQAVTLLKKGADMGRIPGDILVDPLLQPLLFDPTIQSILRDYGLHQFLISMQQ